MSWADQKYSFSSHLTILIKEKLSNKIFLVYEYPTANPESWEAVYMQYYFL